MQSILGRVVMGIHLEILEFRGMMEYTGQKQIARSR